MASITAEQFEKLYTNTRGKVQRLAVRLCRDKTDAEDLVQETAVRAYKYLDSCSDLRAFDNWILTITRNVFIQKEKGRRVRRQALSMSDEVVADEVDVVLGTRVETPLDHLMKVDLDDNIADALSKLPPNSRELILSVVLDEATYAEVAADHQIPIGTVKSRFSRICAHLRKNYEAATGCDQYLCNPA